MLDTSVSIYNRPNIHIAVREVYSYNLIQDLYPNSEVCLSPDIVLSLSNQKYDLKREGVLLCFRDDSEKKTTDESIENLKKCLDQNGYLWKETSMIHQKPSLLPDEWEVVVDSKMKEIASSKVLITDRLHGMILAALTSTPCIVLGNNHHKVHGVYEKWLSNCDFIKYIISLNDSIPLLSSMYDKSDCSFAFAAAQFESLDVLMG